MNIGFTGTQKGITKAQKQEILLLLDSHADIIHHGDCIGADAACHRAAGILNICIIIHPPKNMSKRAFCEGYKEIREPEDYLVRNQHIVNETNGLIATPGEYTEQLRSGTWSTIRKGRKRNNYPIWIVFPDGSVKQE